LYLRHLLSFPTRRSSDLTQSSQLGFGGSETVFVGLSNYVRAFADHDFLVSFGRVALYGIVQVPVMMIIAATLALLFDSAVLKLKDRKSTRLNSSHVSISY